MDDEAQKTRLKALILLGKERGYLLHVEIFEHLPGIVDAEQIASISETFNDMGILTLKDHPAGDKQG